MKQNAKSAIFTRENGKRLLRQLLLLLPAWIVLALGIAMSVFSGVGSDTNTSFQQGLGRMLGLQTGTVTLIFNCTVLAIFIFANRSLVGLGSLVIGFGLGPLLNLYLDLLGKIFPTMPPMWARIALCTLGVVIACIALGWYVQLDAGVQPMDMLILTVAKLILIDCMPSLGMMPINSLAAADSVIIPSQPSYLSAKGLDLLMQSIAKVKRQINPKLKIDGILFTMVDSRTNEAKEIIASLRAHYGEKIRVFGTEIPFSVRAAETSGRGKSIFAHDKNGKVAAAYRSLTKEVLELERKTERFRDDAAR